MGSKRAAAERERTPRRGRRVGARHDRPLAVALLLLVAVLGAMALGPLQRYTAAADRVADLQATREQLSEQVQRLEERRATLEDPEQLELIARTELGLVKPGEIPFVVVAPSEDGAVEQVRPEPAEPASADEGPWYRRLGRAVSSLFDRAG